MKSRTTARFRKAYEKLPAQIQDRASQAYQLFIENPNHPSLRFKRVHQTRPIYSVRITREHRALGVRDNDTMIWFWIGTHSEYELLLKRG